MVPVSQRASQHSEFLLDQQLLFLSIFDLLYFCLEIGMLGLHLLIAHYWVATSSTASSNPPLLLWQAFLLFDFFNRLGYWLLDYYYLISCLMLLIIWFAVLCLVCFKILTLFIAPVKPTLTMALLLFCGLWFLLLFLRDLVLRLLVITSFKKFIWLYDILMVSQLFEHSGTDENRAKNSSEGDCAAEDVVEAKCEVVEIHLG